MSCVVPRRGDEQLSENKRGIAPDDFGYPGKISLPLERWEIFCMTPLSHRARSSGRSSRYAEYLANHGWFRGAGKLPLSHATILNDNEQRSVPPASNHSRMKKYGIDVR